MAGLPEMLTVCQAVGQIAGETDAKTDSDPAVSLNKALDTILKHGDLTTVQKTLLLGRVVPLARAGGTATSRQTLTDTLVALAPNYLPKDAVATRAATTSHALLSRPGAPLLGDRAQTARDQVVTAKLAVADGFLPPDAIHVGTCVTYTVTMTVDEQDCECVVIDTECSSPVVSLTNLKAVVNPFNWSQNYPQFFTNMEELPPHIDDHWTRVLETVSLVGIDGVQSVTTRLRFHTKEDPKGLSASIDYDLDTPQLRAEAFEENKGFHGSAGDGRVIYDRGWINMWVDNEQYDPNSPGVRAKTKKIVHIQGYDPDFQELACYLGYGTASAEFLLGSAGASGRRGFLDRGAATVQELNAAAPQAESEAAKAPAEGRYFAPTGVRIWTDTAREMVDGYLDVATQWSAGQLTVDRLADYTAKTADQMLRAPFEFLEAMTKPRKRRKPAGPNGGGGES